jgi:hypothetical protein
MLQLKEPGFTLLSCSMPARRGQEVARAAAGRGGKAVMRL